MFCPQCGAEILPEAKFCQTCGAGLQAVQPPPLPANQPESQHQDLYQNKAAAEEAQPQTSYVADGRQTIVPVVEYGGFWRRLAAMVLDAIMIGLTMGVITFVLDLVLNIRSHSGAAMFNHFVNVLQVIVSWAYFALMESSAQQGTFGKVVMGLQVTDLEGRRITLKKATIRYAAKFLSSVILMIGYLMVAFTARKQGLHDKIAGTLVVRNRR